MASNPSPKDYVADIAAVSRSNGQASLSKWVFCKQLTHRRCPKVPQPESNLSSRTQSTYQYPI